MSDFREGLIVVAMKAGQMPRKWATRTVDAMLAHRPTVECPECGGTGSNSTTGSRPCPPPCSGSGRVPGETRLAIVEPYGKGPRADARLVVPAAGGCAYLPADQLVDLYRLAPDLPDDRPEWERRLTSGEYDEAADLPEGTQ